MAAKRETLKQMQNAPLSAQPTEGVPPSDLAMEEVAEELRSLYRTREDTFFNGSPQALEMHTKRMLELEAEYAGRAPQAVEADPDRTREGARARSGQDPNGQSVR